MISRFFLALCGYQARDGGWDERPPVRATDRTRRPTPLTTPIRPAPVASPDLYDHLPAFLRLLGES